MNGARRLPAMRGGMNNRLGAIGDVTSGEHALGACRQCLRVDQQPTPGRTSTLVPSGRNEGSGASPMATSTYVTGNLELAAESARHGACALGGHGSPSAIRWQRTLVHFSLGRGCSPGPLTRGVSMPSSSAARTSSSCAGISACVRR